MFCTKCGQNCPDNSAFCTRCGAPIKPLQTNINPEPISPKKSMPVWAWILVSLAGALVVLGLFAHISFSYDPSDPDGSHTLSVDFGSLMPSTPMAQTAPAEQEDTETRPQWTAPVPTEAPAFFEETVIYEDSEIKVTAVDLTEEYSSFDLSFLIENNSSRNIALVGDYFLVNGAVIAEDIYIRAASGKKGYGTLSLNKNDLDAAGVDMIATIASGDLHITDTDNYDEIYFVPFTVETSFADHYSPSGDSAGELLYDKNGIKVTFLTMKRGYSGFYVYLLIQNDTAYMLTAEAENVSVNGFTIGTWMFDQIHPGTARVCEFLISDSDLEESKVSSINEITFEASFLNSKNFRTLFRTGELKISKS